MHSRTRDLQNPSKQIGKEHELPMIKAAACDGGVPDQDGLMCCDPILPSPLMREQLSRLFICWISTDVHLQLSNFHFVRVLTNNVHFFIAISDYIYSSVTLPGFPWQQLQHHCLYYRSPCPRHISHLHSYSLLKTMWREKPNILRSISSPTALNARERFQTISINTAVEGVNRSGRVHNLI